ncbi:MAG: hypothetical protein BRC36_17330 [Cyanobacteria bacterium QH_2_48_84]|nr:MAG: hypothetical protein BRC36_17330 [Cyanobacteria bacterium QH_2_48_84]
MLTIHEFSTSIQVKYTSDGNWLSEGFTGGQHYMNATLDPIPQPVTQAINDELFTIAEGTSKGEPALIGREIVKDGMYWSMIAVGMTFSDVEDKGRTPRLYRYFLSEGTNRLTAMLNWMLNSKKEYVFNPLDYQKPGEPYQVEPHQVEVDKHSPSLDKKDNFTEFLKKTAPIILPSDWKTSPLILNNLAKRKSQENGYPTAWAYRAGGLGKPSSFQVIYPASVEAEQVIKKGLASSPNTLVVIDNEKGIKTAIQQISLNSKVDREKLLILKEALQNPQVTEEYWQKLFDRQGANQQGIYSTQMVRLLALQAVILPATLPLYLKWLEKQDKKANNAFVEFQNQLRKFLVKNNPESDFQPLNQKVVQGVESLILSIVKRQDLFNSAVSLLKSPDGLWGYFYHYSVKSEIEQYLTTAPLLINNVQPDPSLTVVEEEPSLEKLFKEIKLIGECNHAYREEKYKLLARFFEQVSDFQKAALFYQFAEGKVPKKVFKSFKGRGNCYKKEVYGKLVKRHISLLEQLKIKIVKIGKSPVPAYLFMLFLILAFMLGMLGGFFLHKSELQEPSDGSNFTTDVPSGK